MDPDGLLEIGVRLQLALLLVPALLLNGVEELVSKVLPVLGSLGLENLLLKLPVDVKPLLGGGLLALGSALTSLAWMHCIVSKTPATHHGAPLHVAGPVHHLVLDALSQ